MTASHERTGLPLGSDIAAMKKKEVWKEQRKEAWKAREADSGMIHGMIAILINSDSEECRPAVSLYIARV